MTSALDSDLKLALVLCTSTGNSAGKDLSSLADELLKLCAVLVIDIINLVLTEDANLFSLAGCLTDRAYIGVFCIFHFGLTQAFQ